MIVLAGPGDLTVTMTGPMTGPDADFILQGFAMFLYRSDAAGTMGTSLATTRTRSTGSPRSSSQTAKGLSAGYYLAQVHRSEGVGDYEGTATFVPKRR